MPAFTHDYSSWEVLYQFNDEEVYDRQMAESYDIKNIISI